VAQALVLIGDERGRALRHERGARGRQRRRERRPHLILPRVRGRGRLASRSVGCVPGPVLRRLPPVNLAQQLLLPAPEKLVRKLPVVRHYLPETLAHQKKNSVQCRNLERARFGITFVRLAYIGVELADEAGEIVVLEVIGEEVARELGRAPHHEGGLVLAPGDDVVGGRVVDEVVRLGQEGGGHRAVAIVGEQAGALGAACVQRQRHPFLPFPRAPSISPPRPSPSDEATTTTTTTTFANSPARPGSKPAYSTSFFEMERLQVVIVVQCLGRWEHCPKVHRSLSGSRYCQGSPLPQCASQRRSAYILCNDILTPSFSNAGRRPPLVSPRTRHS
jgi:hypothetical protein